MGLFSKKETCSICNNELAKTKLKDGRICKNCASRIGTYQVTKLINKYSIDEINNLIELNRQNKLKLDNFKTTTKIGSYIEFDDNNKQWILLDGLFGKRISQKVYDYRDIVSFELLEDGETVTKGGLGRAIAGGALLGGVGAVVGGVTGKKKTKNIVNSLLLKITLNDINNPSVYIQLIRSKTKTDSFTYRSTYKFAQDILSTLAIISEHTNNNISSNINSEADEILKFKNLLDNGIITQEEFNIKKKELLGI